MLAAMVSLGIFIWLVDEVFEGETRVFDETIRMAVHQIASPLMTSFFIFITALGSAPVLVPAGILIGIVFAWMRWKRALVLFVLTMAGHLVSEFILKEVFQRVRPEAFFDYPQPLSYSFPSGHSFASLCFYGILAWLITARLENIYAKIAIWTFAIGMILLIGTSRVYLGVHFPSDVIGGYLTAFVWVVTVALGDFWFGRRRINKSESSAA
jgi:undecaprenyl-diphosphatase